MFNPVVLVLVGLIASHVSLAALKRDAADQKFTKCCEDKKLPCVKDCWYKAINRSIPLGEFGGECLGDKYFEAYAHCSSGPTDNRDCCKKAGVTNPLCLELCDGTHPLSTKNPSDFFECAKDRASIAQCDHDVNKN
ncbi:hypothetical protein AAVH_01274 [Aphelenchoides avenae]|nr:hypothetical protein AAVH_01274 [Aphelenchus avenae]